MKYIVTVKPNAKTSSVEQISETELRVNVKAPAQDGRANEELIRLLARFLQISQSKIQIKHGTSGRKKVIEIV
jgi:uncharacterized protein